MRLRPPLASQRDSLIWVTTGPMGREVSSGTTLLVALEELHQFGKCNTQQKVLLATAFIDILRFSVPVGQHGGDIA